MYIVIIYRPHSFLKKNHNNQIFLLLNNIKKNVCWKIKKKSENILQKKPRISKEIIVKKCKKKRTKKLKGGSIIKKIERGQLIIWR